MSADSYGPSDYRDHIRKFRLGRVDVLVHRRSGRSKTLPRFDFSVGRGNPTCYCDDAGFMVTAHHFNKWLWIGFDWVRRPCSCDRAIAEIWGNDEDEVVDG